MMEALREQLSELLCPVCLDPFDHPVTIPSCNHNVCRKHVLVLARYHDPNPGKVEFPCPKCRTLAVFPCVEAEEQIRVNMEMKAAVEVAMKVLMLKAQPQSPPRASTGSSRKASPLRKSSPPKRSTPSRGGGGGEATTPGGGGILKKVTFASPASPTSAGGKKDSGTPSLSIDGPIEARQKQRQEELRRRLEAQQRHEEVAREQWKQKVMAQFQQQQQYQQEHIPLDEGEEGADYDGSQRVDLQEAYAMDEPDPIETWRRHQAAVEAMRQEDDVVVGGLTDAEWYEREREFERQKRVRELQKEKIRLEKENEIENKILMFVKASEERTKKLSEDRVRRDKELNVHLRKLEHLTDVGHVVVENAEADKRAEMARKAEEALPVMPTPKKRPGDVSEKDIALDDELRLAMLIAEDEHERRAREKAKREMMAQIAEERAMKMISQAKKLEEKERPFSVVGGGARSRSNSGGGARPRPKPTYTPKIVKRQALV